MRSSTRGVTGPGLSLLSDPDQEATVPAARTASAAARWLVVVIPPADVAWETARWVLLALSFCALV